MISVLSPAKSMNEHPESLDYAYTQPRFLDDSEKLAKKMKRYSRKGLMDLMKISQDLAEVNRQRFDEWNVEHNPDVASPSIYTFTGEVYQGFNAATLSEKNLDFAVDHIRTLSGLYGLLRPSDLIRPYRLEMGKSVAVGRTKNLYQFWGSKIAEAINRDAADHSEKALINLASNEYFKAVDQKSLEMPIYNMHFKDLKNGEYKMIQFYGKRARGLMARFIVDNEIDRVEDLKAFNYENYGYNAKLSNDRDWVFTRDEVVPARG